MIILDEDFLSRRTIGFNFDRLLPLRFQKRQLLESLGFPKNRKLRSCLAINSQMVKSLFKEYSEIGFPFLLIVSQKSFQTVIPPLFTVEAPDRIVHRNDKGKKKEVSYIEMLEIIAQFEALTWLEFSTYIWGTETTAGRLLYIDRCEQIIELQKGVLPKQLLSPNELPLYGGSISYLELHFQNYRKTALSLGAMGYQKILSFNAVKKVVEYLAEYCGAFERLAKISSMPTLEFGILSDQTFVFIDIDWPAQWKEV